ncbi:MAG: Flp pilus assembly complex ATPase component TadA [Armatimonadetes bacterium]|nr:Flp pilus assembly complex ATPase component TadA [Armatimonadota bacterium]
MSTPRRNLGQILVQKGIISETDLRAAVDVARKTGSSRLETVLVDQGLASEDDVLDAKAESIGAERVKLRDITPDPAVVRLVPLHLLTKHKLLPIRRDGNSVVIAMADPTDIIALDDLRMVGVIAKPVLAPEKEIEAKLAPFVQAQAAGGNAAGGRETEQAAAAADPFGGASEFGGASATDFMSSAVQDFEAERGGIEMNIDGSDDDNVTSMVDAEQAPIIRIVNTIIVKSIQDEASDIHIEPQRRNVRVRYRVDGVLHEMMSVPKYVHAPMLSRVKIMSDMDIAERRKPQDGRIPIKHGGKDYDLRVSVIPTVNGEKSVMRILDKSSVLLGLSKLGLFPDTQALLEELVVQPYGILLSCGPTGSGKTTTQYSVLNKLNVVDRNIITIEDPVEYQLPGISQVAVNRKAGVDFSGALRSFLRQDPDIMMVGEIRDVETAHIAIEASLTGHLVLSTVHTNDAPQSVTRLVDMGVEPFLVAASLIGSMAQRLVRKICSECRVAYHPPVEALERFGFKPDPNNPITFYRGQGCSNCRETGYRGRIGIYELMIMNAEISELIVKGGSAGEIRDAARANGMRTLQQDGLKKVLAGMTTIEEVMRVVQSVGSAME